MRPSVVGYWTSAPKRSRQVAPPASSPAGSPTSIRIPSGSARVRRTAIVCGWQLSATKKPRRPPSPSAWHMCIASAAAVASSRSDALARGSAVRSATIGLEVDERLEPALRDLGLIRRVLRVPARILEDVALDDPRGDAVVVAHADVG